MNSDRSDLSLENKELSELLKRLNEGDEAAAHELFSAFSSRLVALARSRMSKQLQQKVDAEDVLQSVFRSFFVRQNQGMFELNDWEGLWGLLVRITLRKCGRNLERFQAARRDIRRENAPAKAEKDSFLSWQAIAREPTAEEATQLSETIEALIRSLDDSDTRKILEMRLHGFSIREISDELDYTERTIHRKLQRIRERLGDLLEMDQL